MSKTKAKTFVAVSTNVPRTIDLQGLADSYMILDIVESKEVQKQLAAVKSLTNSLKKDDCKTEKGIAIVCSLLIPLYMNAHLKNPAKKVFSSCLKNLVRHYEQDIITTLTFHIQELMEMSIKSESCVIQQVKNTVVDKTDNGIEAPETTVENFLSFLDNFPQGEMVLMNLFPKVLHYLQSCIELQEQRIRDCSNPVIIAKCMQISLVTFQVFNKLLQRSGQKMKEFPEDNPKESRPILQDTLKNMYNSAVNILKTDKAVLDVRANCAMSIPLILRSIYKDNVVEKLMFIVFSSHTVDKLPESNMIFPSLIAKDHLPVISYICLINGILAMLDVSHLLKVTDHDQLFVADVVGEQIKLVLQSVSDNTTKLMAARTIVLFTNKCRECLDKTDHTEHKRLCTLLEGTSPLPTSLLNYAWDHWEDHTDVVRHQARTVFENVVACHVKATTNDPKQIQFLSKLTESLLQMGLQRKGVYGPLCCLVGHLGTNVIMEAQLNIVSELLTVIEEQAMASFVSELYEKLFMVHNKELAMNNYLSDEKIALWKSNWVDPVLRVLCEGSINQQKHIIEYIIPKLLKAFPNLVMYIGQTMVYDKTEVSGNKLGALITCLRRAKSMGLLCDKTTDVTLWNGTVPLSVLQHALSHQNEQLRLDAIGMLCEHPKNTEPINAVDLELLDQFLPFSFASQTPAFRQHLLAYVKKLLVRLRDSGCSLMRNIQCLHNKKEDEENAIKYLKSYKVFLTDMCKSLYARLHPSASFPHRTTAVAILQIIASLFPANITDELQFRFADTVETDITQTLLECLMDTFEQNKAEVYAVLKSLPIDKLYMKDKPRLGKLYKASFNLSTSTRPQDCTTAAYLFKVLLLVPEFHEIVLEYLDTKERDYQSIPNNLEGRCLGLVTALLQELKKEIVTAKSSLLHAAATKPLYPALHCIRYLFGNISLRSVQNRDIWKQVLNDVITSCFEVAEVVSPVVKNSSPEGNVCVEPKIIGPGLSLEPVVTSDQETEELTKEEESVTKVNLMPEYLIVCCWRSIKEVSLLLGLIAQSSPVVQSDSIHGLLTIQQVTSIGTYFITQLLESIHRGAFELAYAGFVKMMETLWMSSLDELRDQPVKWLEGIIEDITNVNSKLCSTRRSAGVPFYVQAIISTEPPSFGHKHLKWIMSKLLPLSNPKGEAEESQEENTAQVHSLNILRTLFRDTRLGDEVFPYAADGIQAAILGYSSKFWAVRNSASLLFSALVVRIFGVKRSKDDSSNKKNCMTGRAFFQKFPSLYTFLLEQLMCATESIGTSGEFHLYPGLYPALLVLGRLFPSTTEMVNTSMNLASFIPHVIRCGSSPVYKTRMMASRAIQPLVSRDQVANIIVQLLTIVIQPDCTHNYKHGVFLQVSCLLETTLNMTNEESVKILSLLTQCCHQLQSKNKPCFPVYSALCDVICKVLYIFHAEDNTEQNSSHLREVADFFMSQILLCSGDVLAENEINLWYSQFQKELVNNCLTYLVHCDKTSTTDKLEATIKTEQQLTRFLNSTSYDVQLLALEFILEATSDENNQLKAKNKDRFKLISARLMESRDIFEALVSMMWNDRVYSECLSLALECLCNHTLSSLTHWTLSSSKDISYDSTQIWFRLIQLTEHCLDEVRCAALMLMGVVLKPVCEALDMQCDLLTEVATLLEERCGTQQSVESRQTVGHFLAVNFDVILLSGTKHIGFENNIFSNWTVLVRLLQDEDCDVRQSAAAVVTKCLQKYLTTEYTLQCPIEANMSLETTLKVLTQACIQYFPVKLFSTLLTWIEEELESAWETEDKEVRLFDKGEMNTYKDELSFVYLVSRYTKQLLSSVFLHQHVQFFDNVTVKLLPESVEQIKKFLNQKFQSLYDEIKARLDWVSPVLVEDPFLKQNEYKIDVLYLARKLCCLDTIVHGILYICDYSEKEDLRQMMQFIKTHCQSNQFNEESVSLNNVVMMQLNNMYL